MAEISYIVPLTKAYDKVRTRRANYTVKALYKFLFKNTRKEKEDIILSKGINEFIWKRGIEKPPRKIAINLKLKDNKLYVFLKDSKELSTFLLSQEAKVKEKTAAKKEEAKAIEAKTETSKKAEKSEVATTVKEAKDKKEIKKTSK
ncbi:MAG: hypothetical protein V1824_00885 [archaeon]